MKEIQLMKKMNLTSLIYTGVGSIVGSGWLMSSSLIAQTSGPAAILSWVIGAIIISVIASNFIEICSFLPTTVGGFGHYVEFTHKSFPGFICEWIFLLSWIGLIPAEATASVQYLSSFSPEFTHMVVMPDGGFTHFGVFLASIMCFIYFLINYLSLTTLMRFIKYLTLFKIIVPIVVVITLIAVTHHVGNLGISEHKFMPYGFNGLLTAITTGGVVFAFNGFQTPVTFAHDAENPRRNIPLAIIASVVFCMLIYGGLQLAYLLAVPPQELINHGGWKGISMSAPFLDLSRMNKLFSLAYLLLGAAFLSPFGAGLIYNASTARISRSFGKYLPGFVMKLNKRGVPAGALLFVFLVCLFILWVLPGWQLIVSIVCAGLVLLFGMMCIVNGSLSRTVPEERNKYGIRLKGSKLLSLLGFIFTSLMYYWSAWPLTGQASIVLVLGIPLYLFYYSKNEGLSVAWANIKDGAWLLWYVLFMVILSYFGPFGGNNALSELGSQFLVVVVAIAFYFIGVSKGSLTTQLKYYLVSLSNEDKLE